MGAEKYIDIRIAALYFVGDRRLLRHAAADNDRHFRLFALAGFQQSDISENAVLCVLSYGTGVVEHKIGCLSLTFCWQP